MVEEVLAVWSYAEFFCISEQYLEVKVEYLLLSKVRDVMNRSAEYAKSRINGVRCLNDDLVIYEGVIEQEVRFINDCRIAFENAVFYQVRFIFRDGDKISL